MCLLCLLLVYCFRLWSYFGFCELYLVWLLLVYVLLRCLMLCLIWCGLFLSWRLDSMCSVGLEYLYIAIRLPLFKGFEIDCLPL